MSEKAVKAVRQRSPNYPGIDLEEAIAKASKFERVAGKGKAPFEAALSYLGYAGKSSSGLRSLAALIAFGLLHSEGSGKTKKLWLTDIGRRAIMSPVGSPERIAAIQEAAIRPKLHRELWERWQTGLPDDNAIKSHLRMEHGFNANATEPFIKEFRATLNFANMAEYGNLSSDSGTEQPTSPVTPSVPRLETTAGRQRMEALNASQPQSTKIALSVPLARGGVFFFEASSAITPRDVEKIKKLLEAIQDDREEEKRDDQQA